MLVGVATSCDKEFHLLVCCWIDNGEKRQRTKRGRGKMEGEGKGALWQLGKEPKQGNNGHFFGAMQQSSKPAKRMTEDCT